MGSNYGRQVLGQTGNEIQVIADGNPLWKIGGLTIDWDKVTAVAGADVTLADGTVIKIGQKYLRYGQVLTKITASGKYGPYDPAAVDGRQNLTPGSVFILNKTVLENGPLGLGGVVSNIQGVLEGGGVWRERLLATAGAASLAAGPTFTNLRAAMPNLTWAED